MFMVKEYILNINGIDFLFEEHIEPWRDIFVSKVGSGLKFSIEEIKNGQVGKDLTMSYALKLAYEFGKSKEDYIAAVNKFEKLAAFK